METKSKPKASPVAPILDWIDYQRHWNAWKLRRFIDRIACQLRWGAWNLRRFVFSPGDYGCIGQLLLPLCPNGTKRRRVLDAWHDVARKNHEATLDCNKWELEREEWKVVDSTRIDSRHSCFFLSREAEADEPYITECEHQIRIGESAIDPVIVLMSNDSDLSLLFDMHAWLFNVVR